MKCGHGLLFASLALISIGCTQNLGTTAASGDRISPTYEGPAEASYCSTPVTYGAAVTVNGLARYTKRNYYTSGDGGLGSASTSGTHPASNHPIRAAEVRVTDPSGAVVQCATTTDGGFFTLTLPTGATNYKVSVNSRSYNGFLRASVLNQPERNQFYSLSTTVSATANIDVGTLTAAADGEVLGGAFNILDQLYEANEYLRAQVSNCSPTFSGCRNVTTSAPIPKVVAYWTKGYNPNNYFGATSGLSFYLPGYSRLFILGGQNGDVNSTDTDHFDDSVIIHEYGHFLEDTIGASDSPGGSHNGDRVIDPRLAWSEGWGNFIQAAVRNEARYVDTIGNDDGATELAFYVNIETASLGSDRPEHDGEGNFREFGVTRLLWDAVDSNADTANSATDNVVQDAFNEIWAAFSSTTVGFAYTGYAFRSVGLLHEIQQNFGAATNWSTIRAVNRHDGNQSQYGQKVATGGCGAAAYGGTYHYEITPATVTPDTFGFSTSDQLRNNDFFHFVAPSTGAHEIKLVYVDADGAGAEADLDLYVYKDDYTFGATSSMAGYSRNDPTGAGNVENEPVNVSLSAGKHYILNVFTYTGNGAGTQAHYNILYDGSPLCPVNTVPP